MVAELLRRNHPPPWMLERVSSLFWRSLLRFQVVCSAATVRSVCCGIVLFLSGLFRSNSVYICIYVCWYIYAYLYLLGIAGIGSFGMCQVVWLSMGSGLCPIVSLSVFQSFSLSVMDGVMVSSSSVKVQL